MLSMTLPSFRYKACWHHNMKVIHLSSWTSGKQSTAFHKHWMEKAFGKQHLQLQQQERRHTNWICRHLHCQRQCYWQWHWHCQCHWFNADADDDAWICHWQSATSYWQVIFMQTAVFTYWRVGCHVAEKKQSSFPMNFRFPRRPKASDMQNGIEGEVTAKTVNFKVPKALNAL